LNDISVYEQAVLFLGSVGFGFSSVFIYDMLRIKRRIIKTGKIIVGIEDLLFWTMAAVIAFILFISFSNEEFRFYMSVGALAGMALYSTLLSKYVIIAVLYIVNSIACCFKYLFEGIFAFLRLHKS
jgi:spore cortex biosynthesis protein YabQ